MLMKTALCVQTVAIPRLFVRKLGCKACVQSVNDCSCHAHTEDATHIDTEEHVSQLVMLISLNKGTRKGSSSSAFAGYTQQVACLTAILQDASGFKPQQGWLFEPPTISLSARHYKPFNNNHTLRVLQCSIYECRQTWFTCNYPLHD